MGFLRTYPVCNVFERYYEDFTAKSTGSFSVVRNGNANFNRYARLLPSSITTEAFCTFYLTPGIYTFTFFICTAANAGIATIRINADIVATLDTYSATTVVTEVRTFNYTVTNNKLHTLTVSTSSKNAASTGYDFYGIRVVAKLA